jgi:soluble lytic murein transglycosylase
MDEPAFNAQLGAMHLGVLLGEHKGSYILAFAAYNAGGKRVKEWIDAYGDPRKPGVDAIDWVERIPFTETRNYVQRVMENLVVYRYKFGDGDAAGPVKTQLSAAAAR